MSRKLQAIAFTIIGLIFLAGTVDLENLFNYANQQVPNYISKDNTTIGNPISNEIATLGRVLFYDKKLSTTNTVACASCHQQAFAFGDPSFVSEGANGETGRHSMRLINARFAEESRFFWDERAATLEEQTTMPIQDHTEMGYSGLDGDPSMTDLLIKLSSIDYYDDLFFLAYGDMFISEERIQKALAQFVRSIQSFDSRYDQGLFMNGGNTAGPFPNFTDQENQGKQLFSGPAQFEAPGSGQPASGNRIGGGLGCQGCHQAPEFDIAAISGNNGVTSVANDPLTQDFTITRSPTLRDLFNPNGNLNGPMMHDGSLATFNQVLNHYNDIDIAGNPNLGIILRGSPGAPGPGGTPGPGQKLNLTPAERAAVTAFIRTLTGSNVYTNPRWSDPFDANGALTIIGSPLTTTTQEPLALDFRLYPNPATSYVQIEGELNKTTIEVFSANGQLLQQHTANDGYLRIDISQLPTGVYYLQARSKDRLSAGTRQLIKR